MKKTKTKFNKAQEDFSERHERILELDAQLGAHLRDSVEEHARGLEPVLVGRDAGARHHVDAEALGAGGLREAVPGGW